MDGRNHIPSLDGIRALAALWVFGVHAHLLQGVPGGFGVTVFFFLSGYLITTLLRLEYEKTGDISLRKFYLRRVYRILPPMYIVMALAYVLWLVGAQPGEPSGSAVVAQVAHLTNYFIIFDGDKHIIPSTGLMWSLAVEEHFYLLYPIFLLLLLRHLAYRHIVWILLAICFLVMLWRTYLTTHAPGQGYYTYLATDARIDSILYGCTLGLCGKPPKDTQRLSANRWLWSGVLVIAAAVVIITFQYQEATYDGFTYSLQGLALLPFFYCAIRFNQWPAFRWLELPPVRAMGIISYTFYLTHLLTLHVLRHLLPHKRYEWLMALPIAIAFSAGMYLLVERPLAERRRKLHRA
jgi:peptidoglycan/LPS O-acetylase OafA/YrhL